VIWREHLINFISNGFAGKMEANHRSPANRDVADVAEGSSKHFSHLAVSIRPLKRATKVAGMGCVHGKGRSFDT
jgi:hypothetical protein